MTINKFCRSIKRTNIIFTCIIIDKDKEHLSSTVTPDTFPSSRFWFFLFNETFSDLVSCSRVGLTALSGVVAKYLLTFFLPVFAPSEPCS
jgi:hypothetical protein